jgi:hypothetical protein
VTEGDWLDTRDPDAVLGHLLLTPVSGRKSLLAACACCRQVWHLMTFGTSRRVVELAELAADGQSEYPQVWAAASQLQAAARGAAERKATRYIPDVLAAIAAAHAARADLSGRVGTAEEFSLALVEAADAAVVTQDRPGPLASYGDIERAFCDLLRDVFGNPFRPACVDPAWVTSTVRVLADQMYASRDFSPMPVLADALQDAGCDCPDILGHCRESGPHVRGCWVVDSVLGKS